MSQYARRSLHICRMLRAIALHVIPSLIWTYMYELNTCTNAKVAKNTDKQAVQSRQSSYKNNNNNNIKNNNNNNKTATQIMFSSRAFQFVVIVFLPSSNLPTFVVAYSWLFCTAYAVHWMLLTSTSHSEIRQSLHLSPFFLVSDFVVFSQVFRKIARRARR